MKAEVANWQPTLTGEHFQCRPILELDFEALHLAASDPLIWEQHSAKNRYLKAEFRKYFDSALASTGGLVFVEKSTNRLVGASRYYDWDPIQSSVFIGYTFLERRLWGQGANREIKKLMLAHAFLYSDAVQFHVSPQNIRSQIALEKIGAKRIGPEDTLVDGISSARILYKVQKYKMQSTPPAIW